MGFGKKTGAWVNMETAGFIKRPDQWTVHTKRSVAFGQEIAVSALQIMQAAGIIANDGVLVPPKFVSKIISADGKTTEWENPVNASRQVLRPETARKMLSYMTETASTLGTGWRASIGDINIAVKTGTAQYHDSVRREYSETDFIASCVALLPAETPTLALYAAIIKPKGETYGGRIAAPAIREAADQLINYLGIYRQANPTWLHSGSYSIPEENLPAFTTHIPNFYGLSKRTLLPLLLRNDLLVDIRGEGWVRRQSPPPGTAITTGTMLVLELE
jgi:cell division protein FtsI (penicillin-binding protein 3)